jgi:ferredoxin
MKVHLDPQRCGCTGYCERIAPGVFQLPDGGPARIIQEHPAQADYEAVREAEVVCPTRAISISE